MPELAFQDNNIGHPGHPSTGGEVLRLRSEVRRLRERSARLERDTERYALIARRALRASRLHGAAAIEEARALVQSVADSHGVPATAIYGRRRTRAVAAARKAAIRAVAAAFPRWATTEIAAFFERQDHTTVLHHLGGLARGHKASMGKIAP